MAYRIVPHIRIVPRLIATKNTMSHYSQQQSHQHYDSLSIGQSPAQRRSITNTAALTSVYNSELVSMFFAVHWYRVISFTFCSDLQTTTDLIASPSDVTHVANQKIHYFENEDVLNEIEQV